MIHSARVLSTTGPRFRIGLRDLDSTVARLGYSVVPRVHSVGLTNDFGCDCRLLEEEAPFDHHMCSLT
jgi:hypothetical protein